MKIERPESVSAMQHDKGESGGNIYSLC